jgi:hypothetical protein
LVWSLSTTRSSNDDKCLWNPPFWQFLNRVSFHPSIHLLLHFTSSWDATPAHIGNTSEYQILRRSEIQWDRLNIRNAAPFHCLSISGEIRLSESFHRKVDGGRLRSSVSWIGMDTSSVAIDLRGAKWTGDSACRHSMFPNANRSQTIIASHSKFYAILVIRGSEPLWIFLTTHPITILSDVSGNIMMGRESFDVSGGRVWICRWWLPIPLDKHVKVRRFWMAFLQSGPIT